MNEYDFEPIPGLPENLPKDEKILWQASPDWRVLAQRAFHLRLLTVYFLLLLALRAGTMMASGESVAAAAGSVAMLGSLGFCAAALFALYAWLIARSTLYTITNRRVVMRFGVALPMSINLPFARIKSAAVKRLADGHGDIPLTLDESHRISFIVMWPHVRPWHISRPKPMLRCLPDAEKVAEILSVALNEALPEAQAANDDIPIKNKSARAQTVPNAVGEMN